MPEDLLAQAQNWKGLEGVHWYSKCQSPRCDTGPTRFVSEGPRHLAGSAIGAFAERGACWPRTGRVSPFLSARGRARWAHSSLPGT